MNALPRSWADPGTSATAPLLRVSIPKSVSSHPDPLLALFSCSIRIDQGHLDRALDPIHTFFQAFFLTLPVYTLYLHLCTCEVIGPCNRISEENCAPEIEVGGYHVSHCESQHSQPRSAAPHHMITASNGIPRDGCKTAGIISMGPFRFLAGFECPTVPLRTLTTEIAIP